VTTRLTDEEIAELRRLAAEVPAGPWRAGRMDTESHDGSEDNAPWKAVYRDEPDAPVHLGQKLSVTAARGYGPRCRATAAFIAAARNALPSLLSEVEAARASENTGARGGWAKTRTQFVSLLREYVRTTGGNTGIGTAYREEVIAAFDAALAAPAIRETGTPGPWVEDGQGFRAAPGTAATGAEPIWTTTACPHCGGEVDGIRVLTEAEIGRAPARGIAGRTPGEIAHAFHDAYEALAPHFGYRTREATAKPWDEIPRVSQDLMVATVRAVLFEPAPSPSEETRDPEVTP
jgi:hypothetical protein